MNLIDTHCHLYAPEFKADLTEILQRCETQNVNKILLPAVDSESHNDLLALLQQSTAAVTFFPMMGVHPCSITADFENELTIAYDFLQNTKYKFCAVGEIGLDYHWDISFKKEQIIAFEKQIEWAIALDLPIAIHSRKSTYDCIEILKKYKGKLRGVFHCFSGSIEEANEIIKLDFLLGIGGVVTFKNAGLREVVAALDLQHIVLETDAPYLAPTPYRGKRNEPSYIALVADEIATIKQMAINEVAAITTQNAEKLFFQTK